jgi:hypothetical protein
MHVNARLEHIDFAGGCILRRLHRICTTDDHSAVERGILDRLLWKEFQYGATHDHRGGLDARTRKSSEVLKVEVNKESHDGSGTLHHLKGPTRGQCDCLALEKERLFVGLDVKARKVERDMGFLALVIGFLILEPPFEFRALESKLFGII